MLFPHPNDAHLAHWSLYRVIVEPVEVVNLSRSNQPSVLRQQDDLQIKVQQILPIFISILVLILMLMILPILTLNTNNNANNNTNVQVLILITPILTLSRKHHPPELQ